MHMERRVDERKRRRKDIEKKKLYENKYYTLKPSNMCRKLF